MLLATTPKDHSHAHVMLVIKAVDLCVLMLMNVPQVLVMITPAVPTKMATSAVNVMLVSVVMVSHVLMLTNVMHLLATPMLLVPTNLVHSHVHVTLVSVA
jgi:hypothetical protein